MDLSKYLDEMEKYQNNLIEYFKGKDNLEELILFLNDQFRQNNIHEIKETLKLLLEIMNNCKRTSDFYDKIEKYLINFKNEIKQIFSNFELFDFFKSNKILLLFFIKESLLSFDSSIVQVLNDNKYWNSNYIKFFLIECRPFISEKLYEEIKSDILKSGMNDFEENRKKGENDLFICNLIRNDLINDFIQFVNKTNTSLSMIIIPSIYETNCILSNKEVSLIEYSAFYGSIQIFKYLYLNKVELTPSLWIFAIHGNNPEIIHLLEDKKIEPFDKSYNECLNESIKSFNNEIADYIYENFIENKETKKLEISGFIYHNYYYIPKNNYIFLVSLLLKMPDIKINEWMNINTDIFFYNEISFYCNKVCVLYI